MMIDAARQLLAEITGEIARRLFEIGDGASRLIWRATRWLAGPFAHVNLAIFQKEGGLMETRKRQKKGAIHPKQTAFPYLAEIRPVPIKEPDYVEPAPRWAATPRHWLGMEVVALHPMGQFRVLRVVARTAVCVIALWPNAGGQVSFDAKTGKATDRRSAWRLSNEDLEWLSWRRQADLDAAPKGDKPLPPVGPSV